MVRGVAYWMHVRYSFLHSGLASFSRRSFYTQEEISMNYLRSNPQILSSEHLASDRQLQIILSLGSRLPKIYQLLLQALLSEDIIRFKVINYTSLEDHFTGQSFMELISQSSAYEQVTIWAKRRVSSVLSRNLLWYNSNSAFTG